MNALPIRARFSWAKQNMPLSRAQCGRLPDLRGMRLAVSPHLDGNVLVALDT